MFVLPTTNPQQPHTTLSGVLWVNVALHMEQLSGVATADFMAFADQDSLTLYIKQARRAWLDTTINGVVTEDPDRHLPPVRVLDQERVTMTGTEFDAFAAEQLAHSDNVLALAYQKLGELPRFQNALHV